MCDETVGLEIETTCPYCQAHYSFYTCHNINMEKCIGCDQFFIVECELKITKIQKVQGYKEIK
mgnify:CR=1 FL=1